MRQYIVLDMEWPPGIQGRGPTLAPIKTQLPATITQAEITSSDAHTTLVVPALIADVGDEASWRYIEFFTANIRNPHTRRAYARACARFFAWCEHRGLTLAAIRPFDVATYIEGLERNTRGRASSSSSRLGSAHKHVSRRTLAAGRATSTAMGRWPTA